MDSHHIDVIARPHAIAFTRSIHENNESAKNYFTFSANVPPIDVLGIWKKNILAMKIDISAIIAVLRNIHAFSMCNYFSSQFLL